MSDTMTGHAFAMAMAALKVNGPEGDLLDWDAADWRVHEDNLRRLRQRIFKATQAGDWAKVRSLQKLMLRSRSNTLVSVRRVTQLNAGRTTPGVDGEVALSSSDRARLADRAHQNPVHLERAAGQAGVHTEIRWASAPARNSRDRGSRAASSRYEAHYNGRRPHRSRQLRPPRPDHPPADLSKERIRRRPVLGGLINEYERAA